MLDGFSGDNNSNVKSSTSERLEEVIYFNYLSLLEWSQQNVRHSFQRCFRK